VNVTLVEFDVGTSWDRYQVTFQDTEVLWVSYAPGVWVTSFAGDYSAFDSDLVGAEFTWYGSPAREPAGSAEGSATITRIGSVFVGNIRLPNANGLSALLSLDEAGFYWDDTDELLYVKFPQNNPPDLFSIVVGVASLVSNKQWIDEENQRSYDADLVSLPKVKKTIDPLFFGRIKLNDATIRLQNVHGAYDFLADFDTYGQEIRILYGDTDDQYTNFRRMWTGFVDDYTITESEAIIRASDTRKLLEKPVPVRFFNQTDYTDLDDSDDGKPIPLAYGLIVDVNPMCVNRSIYDKASAQTYEWKLCDTTDHDGIDSIQAVRYKGTALTPVSPITDPPTASGQYGSVDLAEGTFETYKADDDEYDFRDLSVDFTGVENDGTAIETGLDVIVDLISTYGDIPFSNVRYNESQWTSATSDNVGLYVKKDSTIAKEIERIAASLRIQFDVQGDGRFTVRRFDPTAEPVYTVREDEILDPISAVYSSEEFASRIYVEYQGGVYRYTDDENEIIDRYKTTRAKTFETILTNEADATDFATDVMSLIKDLPPLISVTVPIPTTDLAIEQNIYAILNRPQARWFGRMKCRIEGIQFNFDTEDMRLDLRGFESVDDEALQIYSQGYGFGSTGFNSAPGATQYPEVS
jgi:hypothetical protein